MATWVFINSTRRFRMDDWLNENSFVEFLQKNKVKLGEVVYLYTTAPKSCIEYKMIVEQINIPLDESVDDSDFSLAKPRPIRTQQDRFIRLGLLEKVDNPMLGLQELRKHGCIASMQSNFKVSGPVLKYIESGFSK